MRCFITIPIIDVARECNIWTKANTNQLELPARCPFCGSGKKEKPTARINTERNLFFCHRCGEGHNSLTLYAKLTGMDTKGAYRELAQKLYEAA